MDEFEKMESGQEQPDYYAYGQTEYTGGYEENENEPESEDGLYRPYEEPPKPAKEKSGFGMKFAKCVALALVFGLVAGTAFAGTTRFFGMITGEDATSKSDKEALSGGDLHISGETETADSLAAYKESGAEKSAEGGVTDVSDVAEQSMPSIVSITTIARTQMPGFFFGRTEEYESEGCGSGIIVSQDEEFLYIATNNHVVEGAQTLTVLFDDGETANAKMKGTDPSSDLAVVSVALEEIKEETKKSIRVATFGDSSGLKIGQTAIAIGNALGYGQSVTTGVVSALDREVTVTNETDGSTITNELLQTSAAINPGNSGGALLNAKGEVIGITSVKYAQTSVEGMGYAIPSKMAMPIIRQLITREVVESAKSAYFGISGVDVTQSESDTYHMPQGIYITQVVEGSGAAEAGLMQGDIITRFDGRNVKSMEEVRSLMKYLPAGTEVEVTIQRAKNGTYEEHTLDVTMGKK